MEEIVFKALMNKKKFSSIDHFIQYVIANTHYENDEVTYDKVKDAVFKLIMYGIISVDTTETENCILKEENFYKAKKLGTVALWLSQERGEEVTIKQPKKSMSVFEMLFGRWFVTPSLSR
ncbi:hypothetical protein [Tenacibaculum agarivorans]|uniref:hypothetical protein n=1 Tax=Tenacibaculum agarivorans TaxID=1908389 RepID=UPI00094BB4AF|nr:hypothetical protein [Tenacibaculum agarivorans]